MLNRFGRQEGQRKAVGGGSTTMSRVNGRSSWSIPTGTVHVGILKPQSTRTAGAGGPPKYFDYGNFGDVGGVMGSPTPLERLLRAKRYAKAVEACERILDGVGVSEDRRRVLDLSHVDILWPSYVSRLRAGGDTRERWPAGLHEDVLRRIDALRKTASVRTVVWLSLVNAEPVGIEVPADTILGAGLSYLVSPAGDLMLTTRDLAHGVCIELNHTSDGDEYEIVAWGAFTT